MFFAGPTGQPFAGGTIGPLGRSCVTKDAIHLVWMVNQVGRLEANQRATRTPPGSSGW